MELLVIVQAALAALKFSDSIVKLLAELEVAEAERVSVSPEQIAAGDTEAVTPVGAGFIAADTAVRDEEQPEVLCRAAA